ncbi:MAG TPA: PEP-utilizing enzyme [Marmoricola sp.]|nr:PEP-utilizing enzyme [Marmoricola sp.]
MTLSAGTAPTFEPPGPGSWTLDPVHFPRPVSRYFTTFNVGGFAAATADFLRYYGLPMAAMEMAFVNGFAYQTQRPLSPEQMPERFQRAEEVFEQRLWREQLREWEELAKPTAIAKHRELQSVDPDALPDQELADYVRRCGEHHAAMQVQHMRFTGAAMVPVCDLLAHVLEWTDVPPAEVLGMMRGAAPISAGASAQLTRLIAAFAADPPARAVLDSADSAEVVLGKLRALGNDVSRALSDYLDLVGYRLLDGFDISGRYALELPEVLVRAIRSWASGSGGADVDHEASVAAVRNRVPEEHRAEFDDLLAEARLTYHIRDERGVYSDIWASGITRRAVLAAGRRLAARGRILDPEHLVDADLDEMAALITGAGGPSAEELAGRHDYRTTHTAKDAPAFLGEPPSPPPPPEGLPPGTARVVRAFGVGMGEMFNSTEPVHEEKVLRGLAASGGVYEGPARRVSDPSEFDRIQQGDVLVTESTSEAFNILLPLLGAIVTDSGGLLSHSAIVAREYGIPGVVGTRSATDRISDGVRLRVDGDRGEVTVLS